MPVQSVAPFLNDYKKTFLVRRVVQNLFGGIIFFIDGKIPWFIILIQVILFLNPFLIGGIFILISDTTSFDRINASISASLIFISYLILLKVILAIILNKKYLKEIKIKNESNDANNSHSKILTQDNEFHSIDTVITFIFPSIQIFIVETNHIVKLNKLKLFKYIFRITIDSLIAGFVMFCSVNFESIVYLQSIKFSVGGAICIFIFNWIVLCLTLYSLCIQDPAEPAVYQPYDNLKIQHYTRTFYVVCFQIIEMIYKYVYHLFNIF
jgi:hypothetical protein